MPFWRPTSRELFEEGTLKRAVTILFWVHLLVFPCLVGAQEEPGNDDPAATTSLGVPLGAPLSPINKYAVVGLGMNASAGYNFDRRNALMGEFTWNWLFPTEQSLRPVQLALQTNQVSGHGNLFGYTAEYRYELRGRSLGTYFIGGGGWYYRTASLSRSVPAGTTISCLPAWVWWGYNCSSGTVVTNLTEIHSNSSALGVNGGVGMTFRVGEAPYRIFVETRYHFAPTKSISTQLIIISWGIRY